MKEDGATETDRVRATKVKVYHFVMSSGTVFLLHCGVTESFFLTIRLWGRRG